MTKHTPGPWRATRDGLDGMLDTGGVTTGFDVMASEIGSEEPLCVAADVRSEADARLIAAAPDLLDACEAAVEELGDDENYVGDHGESEANILADLRAALRKARGE